MNNYILHEDTSIEITNDTIKWGKFFETNVRLLANTKQKGVRVSTVFLGLDHSYDRGPPLIFETMIFGGEHDQWCGRYSTLKQALQGHIEACIIAGVDHGINIQRSGEGV